MKLNNKLFVMPIIFGVIFLFTISLSSAIVWDNKAYWNFEENSGSTLIDVASGYYNGTFNPGFSWAAQPKLGTYAGNFSGAKPQVNISNVILGRNNFTLTGWFMTNDTSQERAIAGDQDGDHRWLVTVNATARVNMFVGDGATWSEINMLGGNTAISLNTYYFLALVRNGTNMTVYINNISQASKLISGANFTILGTNMSLGGLVSTNNHNGLEDEFSFWNRTLSLTELSQLYNSGNGLDYNSQITIPTLLSPVNGTNTYLTSLVFNATLLATSGKTLKNGTFYIWNSSNALINRTTNITTSSNRTNVTLTIGNFALGSYQWNVLGCDSGNCSFDPQNFTFNIGGAIKDNGFNNNTYETSAEIFNTNITIPNATTISTVNIYYGGTAYSGTSTSISGNNYSLNRVIDIPLGIASNAWFWSINFLGGFQQNLSSNSQTVGLINFTLCEAAPQNIRYINFTFKNETVAQESVSAVFNTVWSYYLGTGTINKSYTSISTVQNLSYAYCFSPQNRTLYANPGAIVYSNTESQQKSTTPGTYSLTNISTNVSLLLLPTSLGQYVTFQVINPAGQSVVGAIINASSSTFGQLELKVTDSSGGATFFLNPLISYTIIVSASGYASQTNTITPTSTSYTIQLGGSAANASINDYTRGITSAIKPTLDTQLMNSTIYRFNLTLTSTYWNLDSFGFILKNASGSSLASQSSASPTGGIVSADVNTGVNNTKIVMDYFWVVNGTYINNTVFWIVTDGVDSQYSLRTLFSDLTTYLTSGIFGLTSFGLALIVFLGIFVFTGVASYKFGITSPGAIMVIIFGLVAFFDVGLNLIPMTVLAIPHFPTAFTLLILVGVLLMEGSK